MSKNTGLFPIVLTASITLFGSYVLHDDAVRGGSTGEIWQFVEGAEIDPSMIEQRVISSYDGMMRRIAKEEGQDWVLMSAIAYNESRFDSDCISKRGAMGLMQVMPVVSKQFNVDKELLLDPEMNIRLAGKLLKDIDSKLKISPKTPADDRMSIIIACYNIGIGHISDARRLARSNGENPNSWEVVAYYLRRKAEPEIYESELVRNGKFTNSDKTEAYVKKVLKSYDKYREMVAAAKKEQRART